MKSYTNKYDQINKVQEIISKSAYGDSQAYENKYNTVFEFIFPLLYKINLRKSLSRVSAVIIIIYYFFTIYLGMLETTLKYQTESKALKENQTQNNNSSLSRILFNNHTENNFEQTYNSALNFLYKKENSFLDKNRKLSSTKRHNTTLLALQIKYSNYSSIDRTLIQISDLVFLKFLYITNFNLSKVITSIFVVTVFYFLLFWLCFLSIETNYIPKIISYLNYFFFFIFSQISYEAIKYIFYCRELYLKDENYIIENPNSSSSFCNIKAEKYSSTLILGVTSLILIYLICLKISFLFFSNNKYDKVDVYNRLNTFYEILLLNFNTLNCVLKIFDIIYSGAFNYIVISYNVLFLVYLLHFFHYTVYFFDFVLYMINKISLCCLTYTSIACFTLFFFDIENKIFIIVISTLVIIPLVYYAESLHRERLLIKFKLENNTSIKYFETYVDQITYLFNNQEIGYNKSLLNGIFTYYINERNNLGLSKVGHKNYYLPLTNEYFHCNATKNKNLTYIDNIMLLNLIYDLYNYSFKTLGNQFNLVISWSNFLNYAYGNAYKTIYITQTSLKMAKYLNEQLNTFFVIENFNRKIFLENQMIDDNKLNLSVIFLYERACKQLLNSISSLCNNQITLWKKLISFEIPETFESLVLENQKNIISGFFNIANSIYEDINVIEQAYIDISSNNPLKKGNSIYFIYSFVKYYLLEDEDFKSKNIIEQKISKTLDKYFKLFEDDSCAFIVDISETLGKIVSFTKNTNRIYNYKYQALKEKNISIIMPRSVAILHNSFLKTFQVTGKQNILEVADRNLFTCDSNNKLLPSSVTVNFLPLLDFSKIFCIGNIIIKQTEEEYFLVSKESVIDLVTIKDSSLEMKYNLLGKIKLYIQFIIPELVNYSRINSKGVIVFDEAINNMIYSPIFIPHLLHKQWELPKDSNVYLKKLSEFCHKGHKLLRRCLEENNGPNKSKYKRIYFKFLIENSYYYKCLLKEYSTYTTDNINLNEETNIHNINAMNLNNKTSNLKLNINIETKNVNINKELCSYYYSQIIKLHGIECESLNFEKINMLKVHIKTKYHDDVEYSVDESLEHYFKIIDHLKSEMHGNNPFLTLNTKNDRVNNVLNNNKFNKEKLLDTIKAESNRSDFSDNEVGDSLNTDREDVYQDELVKSRGKEQNNGVKSSFHSKNIKKLNKKKTTFYSSDQESSVDVAKLISENEESEVVKAEDEENNDEDGYFKDISIKKPNFMEDSLVENDDNNDNENFLVKIKGILSSSNLERDKSNSRSLQKNENANNSCLLKSHSKENSDNNKSANFIMRPRSSSFIVNKKTTKEKITKLLESNNLTKLINDQEQSSNEKIGIMNDEANKINSNINQIQREKSRKSNIIGKEGNSMGRFFSFKNDILGERAIANQTTKLLLKSNKAIASNKIIEEEIRKSSMLSNPMEMPDITNQEYQESALLLESPTQIEEKSKYQTNNNKLGNFFKILDKESENMSYYTAKSNNSHVKKIQSIRKGIFTNKKPKIISLIAKVLIVFILFVLSIMLLYYLILLGKVENYQNLISSSLSYNITTKDLIYIHHHTRNIFLIENKFYAKDRNKEYFKEADYYEYNKNELKKYALELNSNLMTLENNDIKNLLLVGMNSSLQLSISKGGVYEDYYFNKMKLSNSLFQVVSNALNLLSHANTEHNKIRILNENFDQKVSEETSILDTRRELSLEHNDKYDNMLEFNLILTNSINNIYALLKIDSLELSSYLKNYKQSETVNNLGILIGIILLLIFLILVIRYYHISSSEIETSIIKIMLSSSNINCIKFKLKRTLQIHNDLYDIAKNYLHYSTEEFEIDNIDSSPTDVVTKLGEEHKLKKKITKVRKTEIVNNSKKKNKKQRTIREIKEAREKIIKFSLAKNYNQLTLSLYTILSTFFVVITCYYIFVFVYIKQMYDSCYDNLKLNNNLIDLLSENVLIFITIKESILGLIYTELKNSKISQININSAFNTSLTFNSSVPNLYYQKIHNKKLEEFILVNNNENLITQDSKIKRLQSELSANEYKNNWNLIFNSDLCQTLYSSSDTNSNTNGELNDDVKATSQNINTCEAFSDGLLKQGLVQTIEQYNRNALNLLQLINSQNDSYQKSVNYSNTNYTIDYLKTLSSYFNFTEYRNNEILIENYLENGYLTFLNKHNVIFKDNLDDKQNISKVVTGVLFTFIIIGFLFSYKNYFVSLKLRFKQVLTLLCILPTQCVKDLKIITQLNTLELE